MKKLILIVCFLCGCATFQDKLEKTAGPPSPPSLWKVTNGVVAPINDRWSVAMSTSSLTAVTVATLPTGAEGKSAVVSDGADSCDCTVGSGTVTVECVYSEGAWVSKTCAGSVTDVDDLPGDTVDDNLIDRALLAGLLAVDIPNFAGMTFGVANTTTGLISLYSNTAQFPFGLYAAGSAGVGVGWRFPAAMATGDSYVWVNTSGNLDYTLKTTLAHFVQAADDPDVNDDITTYLMGTIWHNTTDDGVFQLADNTDGAAVWVELTATGSISDLDDLPGDTVDDNLIDAAIVAGLAAIDTEAELEALLEVADLQGDFDPDRLSGDTVDDDKVDAAILAITSMDLNYDSSTAAGHPLTSDDSYSGMSLVGRNAGENVAQWEAVYYDTTATEYLLADADATGEYPAHGLATAASSDGAAVVIIERGWVRNDEWDWTPGGDIYISTTAGGLTQTQVSIRQPRIGWALTADIIWVDFPKQDLPTWYAYDVLPIGWAETGTSGPDALDDTTRDPLAYRTFASDADEDVNFTWFVPSDLSGTTIQYRVKYLVTNATGPTASEGVAFGLSGVSAGDNDASNAAKGTVVVVTDDALDAAQWDIMQTGWSGDVTVTNLAAGEVAELAFIRDVSDAVDDYGQVVGVLAVEIRYVQAVAR